MMSEASLTQHVAYIEAGDNVVAAAFLGRTPVFALADGTILIAAIGEEKRVRAHEDGAILVALSDGKRMFTGGDDGLLIATDAEGRSEILADENGILVLPPDPAFILECAERAIGMQNAEKTTLKRLDAGEKLPDITGASAMIREKMAKT